MFDGVGEDLCSPYAIFLRVLLGAYYDGFGAITLVDAVDHLVELVHLLYLLGIDIEQVLLNGTVGGNAHHNDSSTLVLYALDEDFVKYLCGCLDDGDGGACWGYQSGFIVLPVL